MNTTTEKRDAVNSARAFLNARGEYSKNFKIYLGSLESLSEKRFWEMADIYCHLIIANMERNDVTKFVARELFRQSYADSKKFRPSGVKRKSLYTFDEAVAFANDWGRIATNLYRPLFEIVENRSDDSYGDLLDNLPLLGPKFYARCLNKDFSNGQNFETAAAVVANIITNANGMETAYKFKRFILNGENYNGMKLREHAEEYFAFHVRKD